MRKRSILQTLTDLAMAALLPLLMAYSLIGEAAHEWMGTAMLCLCLLHQVLNRRWYRTLFRGRYTAVRILHTAVNFLLLADLTLMGISGILMSSHVFSFLHLPKGASLARRIHLPGAYWGYLLLSFHIGMHRQAVAGRIRALRQGGKSGTSRSMLLRILLLSASAYGVFAFFRRRFPDYLFFRTQFVFFDYEEAPVFYLLDLLAIMLLFAALGDGCVRLLTKAKKKKKNRTQA